MLARLDPQSEAERDGIRNAGIDPRQILTEDTLITSDDAVFAATGISGGTFLRGVTYHGWGAVTHSLSIRGKTGTVRMIEAFHNWDKLMQISAINYASNYN
jgi:fructose-1,6-bisphosphatase II